MNSNVELKEEIKKSKKIALKKLVREMNYEKLVILQSFLTEYSIKYDDNINDYYTLINYCKKNLDKNTLKVVLDKCNEIDKSFQELINALSNGSTNSFDNFFHNIINIAKPLSVGLALNTAVKLAPTPVIKLVPMSIGLIYSGYKLCKNHKYKKLINKETRLNLRLQNHEFKYDANGKLVDTRFNDAEQKLIRNKLKEMKVNFVDLGYNSLRSCIYSLTEEQKVQLLMCLEGKTNRKDFDNEIKKYNEVSFLEKKRSLPLTTVFSTGVLEQVGILNIIQTTGLVALNGMLAAKLTESITNKNVTLSALAGILSSSATAFNLDSPVIQVETVFIGVIIAETIRLVANSVRNFKNSIENNKLTKAYLQIELEKYCDMDNEEKKRVSDYINSSEISKHIGESVIIDILTRYIENNLRVPITSKPKNVHQLSLIINGLNTNQKRKIHNLMDEFKHFNKHTNNQFLRCLEKMLKTTGMMAIFGIAGLSIVDIFTKGEFLNNLNQQLFFKEAPSATTIEVEYVNEVVQNPGLGLTRPNENGEHILTTTYKANVGNEAFNTHCNYYYDPIWLKEQTGMTIDEYMGHYRLEDYESYKNVADTLLSSPYFTEADKQQLNVFKEFLEMMIKKRKDAQVISEVGSVVAGVSAGAGIIGSGKGTKKKIKGTVHKR